MNEFQIMAAKTTLKNMFDGKRYFDICTVDKLLKLTGCIPNAKDYQALSALHCVHWMDMEPELRQMVMLKTLQMFEHSGFDMKVIENVFLNESTALLN